jgi:hypothetical protein
VRIGDRANGGCEVENGGLDRFNRLGFNSLIQMRREATQQSIDRLTIGLMPTSFANQRHDLAHLDDELFMLIGRMSDEVLDGVQALLDIKRGSCCVMVGHRVVLAIKGEASGGF